MTSILDTVSSNNSRVLQILLAVPKNIKKRDLELGLLQAAKHGFPECVELLLACDVDPDIQDPSGNTPLHHAVQSNHHVVVKLLIASHCCISCRGSGRNTALHIAAKLGHEESLKLLLEHGANVNLPDSAGNTPLILAAKNGQYVAMKALIGQKCNINAVNNEGCCALHYAAHKARGVDMLLEAGANPNICDHSNTTPLLMAATEGFDKVVKALVDANCDVNIANNSVQRTALHILAFKGHSECIDDLIYGGADINLCDKQYHTPLWYAIKNHKFEVVKLLLRANSQADTYQCSPVIPPEACPVRLALMLGMINVIKLFILTGYDQHHMRAYLQQEEHSDWLKEIDDFSHWLDHASGVLTLKQTCRKWIRHHLGRAFYHNLQDMPLPQAMKDYLFMKELDDH